uniref:Uncharacterized protein n=1 Tax=Oryza punctata TaxID=4537 RepID=A0A0E0M4X7_ORYPU
MPAAASLLDRDGEEGELGSAHTATALAAARIPATSSLGAYAPSLRRTCDDAPPHRRTSAPLPRLLAARIPLPPEPRPGYSPTAPRRFVPASSEFVPAGGEFVRRSAKPSLRCLGTGDLGTTSRWKHVTQK